MKDLKNLLFKKGLAANQKEKDSSIALLDEVLSSEANIDIASALPKLTNGKLKI